MRRREAPVAVTFVLAVGPCCCVGSAAILFCAPAVASELVVEHAYIRRQTESDTGTVHLFVRNANTEPVEVVSLLSVGESSGGAPSSEVQQAVARILASEDEEEEPYLWWRAWPNPVPAGGFADVEVKLSRVPTRKVAVHFACSGGSKLKSVLSRINDGLELRFVGFSPELDTLYIYVENRLDVAVRIKRVRINGEDVTARSRSLWGSLAPLGNDCVIVPLKRPLQPGAFVFLQVDGDQESAQCAGLVRAFSGFPITWLDGSLPDGLEEPPGKAEHRPGQVRGEGLAGYENIMRCPAHVHGTRQEAASKFILHHRQLLASEPEVPGMILVCRWDKEVNYFAFGELADVMRVMPFARSFAYPHEPLEDRTQWLTSLAACAAAPRPVHAVVPIRFADSHAWTRSCTPQEIRALVYFPLSRGAKGLCYGRRQKGLSEESRQMLAQVTREIASIRAYLQFSDYMPLGATDNPSVEAATLLAGHRGIVLLLINHRFQDFDNDHILEYVPQKKIRSTIRLPSGLTVASIKNVTDLHDSVTWRQEGDRVTLETDRLALVQPYLIVLHRTSTGAASLSQGVN